MLGLHTFAVAPEPRHRSERRLVGRDRADHWRPDRHAERPALPDAGHHGRAGLGPAGANVTNERTRVRGHRPGSPGADIRSVVTLDSR